MNSDGASGWSQDQAEDPLNPSYPGGWDPGWGDNTRTLTYDFTTYDLTGNSWGPQLQLAVNIDPGYVTLSKLVLATTKDYSHRIYIGKGIYGEVTLQYTKGTFTPFPHTYPDYQTRIAIEFFNQVRDFVKKNIT